VSDVRGWICWWSRNGSSWWLLILWSSIPCNVGQAALVWPACIAGECFSLALKCSIFCLQAEMVVICAVGHKVYWYILLYYATALPLHLWRSVTPRVYGIRFLCLWRLIHYSSRTLVPSARRSLMSICRGIYRWHAEHKLMGTSSAH